jgi:hypothetical protein
MKSARIEAPRPDPTVRQRLVTAVLADYGIPDPQFEYLYATPRRFRFDLAWPRYHVAVEIDGGVYGLGPRCPACGRRKVGAHSSIKDILRDHERANIAARYGWTILRYTPEAFGGKSGYGVRREVVDDLRRVLCRATHIKKLAEGIYLPCPDPDCEWRTPRS